MTLSILFENRIRQRLGLPMRLEKNVDRDTPDVAESFTKPKTDWLNRTKKDTRSEYESNIQRVNSPKDKPFSNVIPHVRTLTTLAELGSPAKGEYENTFRTVKQLFGHDPDGVTAWLGLNGVFSPNTSYKDHAGAASMLTAAWINAGKPTDEHAIRHLIHAVDTFGKHYSEELAAHPAWNVNPETGKYTGITPGAGESFGGTMRSQRAIKHATYVLQNIDTLRKALEDPAGKGGENLSMLGGGGTSKVPNLVLSYPQPMFGSAIDTHMAQLLMHPSLDNFQLHSDILRQVRAHLSKPRDLERLEAKSLKGIPIKSELVRALMQNPYLSVKAGKTTRTLGSSGVKDQSTVADWIKQINANLLSKPQHYLGYKYAINEAAKKLGWTPSEVQESVWTGILALMAANEVGIPKKQVLQHLTSDVVRKGWENHEAIYFPKLVDALIRGGANQKTLRKLGKGLDKRAAESSRPGIIRVRDEPHLSDIAPHLPGITARSAGKPILDALRQRLQEEGLIDPATGKYRLRRLGDPIRLAGGSPGAFQQAILRSPNDVAPGMIFADWLDERGAHRLASLYRNTQWPGNPAGGIQNHTHDLNRWKELQDAMLEYGKPSTAELLGYIQKYGKPTGISPFMTPEVTKQLWGSHVFAEDMGGRPFYHRATPELRPFPSLIIPGASPVRLSTGGVRTTLLPLATDDYYHQHQGRPESFFATIGHKDTESSPGGIYVTPEHAHRLMHEADTFDTPNDAEWAAKYTGNPQLNQLSRQGFPLRLMAKYDMPLNFGSSLQRVEASNQAPFIEALRETLRNSGINPEQVFPAIHDNSGQTRTSAFAIGKILNPKGVTSAASWVGLLGRQPGMLAFRGNPMGKDSIYHFTHYNADIVRNVLQNAGITNRTIVPQKNHYSVYVYDPQNKMRDRMAVALHEMNTTATEWRGDGEPIGGRMEDMGRSQYRDKINQAESAQPSMVESSPQG